ncbi:MAG TPA: hypothetical protein VNR11_12165 [Xanthobacteraceae bacterium]|nr:hypothetical protein [Xanthobacteraceae bacterium]
MTQSITTAPPNAFVIIAGDMKRAKLPEDYPTPSRYAATSSCIFAGCSPDVDGDTIFTIGPHDQLRPAGLTLLFDGVIDTPRRSVSVWTIAWDTLLEEKVATDRTRVRIWGNRPEFPDRVVIGLG